MTRDRPVVLVVGAASRDIVPDDPRGWRLGGAVTYGSLTLARFGFEVWAVVGADSAASRAGELDLLRATGASVALAELASGPVFDNVRHLLHAMSDRVPLTRLPRRWTSGFDAVLLAPVADELGDEWATLAGGEPAPLVGLGWQGLLRELEAGTDVRPKAPSASALSGSANLAVVSRDDVVAGVDPASLLDYLARGASLFVTEGEAGGVALGRDADGASIEHRYPAIPSDGVVDPTGAGDVFLASMLATRLQPALADGLPSATTFAAAAASLAVEGPGLLGVPDLAAVRRRAERAVSLPSRRPSSASSPGIGRPSQA
jgi:hypothetical protein